MQLAAKYGISAHSEKKALVGGKLYLFLPLPLKSMFF